MDPYLQCNVFVSAERCISSAPPSKRRGLDHCIEALRLPVKQAGLEVTIREYLRYFTCSHDRRGYRCDFAIVQEVAIFPRRTSMVCS